MTTSKPVLRTIHVLALGVVLAGCTEDPPTCPERSPLLVISGVSDGAGIIDVDPNVDGVQIDVAVRSDLPSGTEVVLEVSGIDGQSSSTSIQVGDDGSATFTSVTLPDGPTKLTVASTLANECGTLTDERNVFAIGTESCNITFETAPAQSSHYAMGVFNAASDGDTERAGLQTTVRVQSIPEADIEVTVVDLKQLQERNMWSVQADSDGIATYQVTLGEGNQRVRARCSAGDWDDTSALLMVHVDTIAPTCSIASPLPGTSLIPDMDSDAISANGSQIVFRGQAAPAHEVNTEAATFTVDGTDMPVPPISGDGHTETTLSFMTAQDYTIGFSTRDHAGNECAVEATYSYVTDGCAISLIGPTEVVASDANGDGGDGLTATVIVDVGSECAGRTVTTDCSLDGDKTGTVPAGGGQVSIDVQVCATTSCEAGPNSCTAHVTSVDGITTSVGLNIEADTIAPSPTLVGISPSPAPCGAAVTDSADSDPGTPGVQVTVQLAMAETPEHSWIGITNGANPAGQYTAVAPATNAVVTLEPGANVLNAIAEDAAGNRGTSADCTISLADIGIVVGAPADDGIVAGHESGVTSSGPSATFDLCGTTSEVADTVDVSFNGQTPVAATVTGSSWCVSSLTLAEGNHTFTVSVVAGARTGLLVDVPVTVDVTPPDGPVVTAWTSPTRHQGQAIWTSTSAEQVMVKWSTSPITDANFDGIATGSTEPAGNGSKTISNFRAGTPYWVAVAAADSAGNRSVASIAGPINPAFDATGAIDPSNPQNGDNKHFGWSIAHGKLNSDNYDDIAIAAPFETASGNLFGGVVYVYLGGPTGIPSTPAYRIESPSGFSLMGYGLTMLQWDDDPAGRADLAIGSPYTNTIYVFPGGSDFDPPGGATLPITITANEATTRGGATITVATDASYLSGGALGWSLARARFDSDARDDLIAGVPSAGGGLGGAVVIYGGTAGDIAISDMSGAEMNNAQVHLFKNPEAVANTLVGNRVLNLGPTAQTTDDIAITRVADLTYSDNDRVYVLRSPGGAKPAAGGPAVDLAFEPSRDLSIAPLVTTSNTYFGDSLGTVPSINGDGVRDIVIGAFLYPTGGKVFIVDGAATGARMADTPANDPTNGIALAVISGEAGQNHFGKMVLNNAATSAPDIDADGQEDLVIAGGNNDDVKLYVWFADQLPTADTDASSAAYVVDAPTDFQGLVFGGRLGPIVAHWVGDTNGDGLDDICWADHNASTDGGSTTDGVIEVLWDNGL